MCCRRAEADDPDPAARHDLPTGALPVPVAQHLPGQHWSVPSPRFCLLSDSSLTLSLAGLSAASWPLGLRGCSCIFGFILVGVCSFFGGGRGAGLACSHLGPPPFRTPVQCSHSLTIEN